MWDQFPGLCRRTCIPTTYSKQDVHLSLGGRQALNGSRTTWDRSVEERGQMYCCRERCSWGEFNRVNWFRSSLPMTAVSGSGIDAPFLPVQTDPRILSVEPDSFYFPRSLSWPECQLCATNASQSRRAPPYAVPVPTTGHCFKSSTREGSILYCTVTGNLLQALSRDMHGGSRIQRTRIDLVARQLHRLHHHPPPGRIVCRGDCFSSSLQELHTQPRRDTERETDRHGHIRNDTTW